MRAQTASWKLSPKQRQELDSILTHLRQYQLEVAEVSLLLLKKWIDVEKLSSSQRRELLPWVELRQIEREEGKIFLEGLREQGFLSTEEVQRAFEWTDYLHQQGLPFHSVEVLAFLKVVAPESLYSLWEAKLAAQQPLGKKKKPPYGFYRSDYLFLKVALQQKALSSFQVWELMERQRRLYQFDIHESIPQICFLDGFLKKEQILKLLEKQGKRFREKGAASSELKRWSPQKDREIVKVLHKFQLLKRECIEEAVEVQKQLEKMGIKRMVGEILLAQGIIQRTQVEKVLSGQVESLLEPEVRQKQQSKSLAQVLLIYSIGILCCLAFGALLERVSRTGDEGAAPLFAKDLENVVEVLPQEKKKPVIPENPYTPKDKLDYLNQLAEKYPEQREMLIQKYENFIREHKDSPLVAEAKKRVAQLKRREAVEYEKLVKKTTKIVEENPEYGIFLAEDHVKRFAEKYRGTKWEKKAYEHLERLKKRQKELLAAAKAEEKPNSSQEETSQSAAEELGLDKRDVSLEEREKLAKIFQKVHQALGQLDYHRAKSLLAKAKELEWKHPLSQKRLERAERDVDLDELFFRSKVLPLVKEKATLVKIPWRGRIRPIEKVNDKGVTVEGENFIPWSKAPIAFWANLVRWKRWEKKDYYGLGVFLAHRNLQTLAYPFFEELIRQPRSPYRQNLYLTISRLENIPLSETGFRLFRDRWERTIDYEQLRLGKVYYMEKWYDKQTLLKQYGQSLTEKMRARQEQEARQALVAWRKKLYREQGVYAIDTILQQGDPSKRVDVVIMCDGFLKEQLPKVRELGQKIVAQLKKVEPFRSYSEHLNIHRVELYEEEEGISGTSEKGATTRLGCYVNNLNQLKCTVKKVRNYAALAPDADLIVIIANVRDVRPTGGNGILCIDVAGNFDDRVTMGLGFAFGKLSVEYVDLKMAPKYPPFPPEKEFLYFNVTRESNPKKVKWHYWNYPHNAPPKVGCFEGAYYRDKGFYRPTEECRMKSYRIQHFCVVCLEQLERSFYRYLSPIDSFAPILPLQTIFLDDKIKFHIQLLKLTNMKMLGGKYEVDWFVNGKWKRSSRKKKYVRELVLWGKKLGAGRHTVAVTARFFSKRVRRDLGVLEDQRVWEVKVLPVPRPRVRAPRQVLARAGKVTTFELRVLPPFKEKEVTWQARNLPERAVFDSETATFQWCPGAYQRGQYTLQFELRLKKYPEVVVPVEVPVKVQASGDNTSPFFRYHPPIVIREGELLEQKLLAFDVDGDHLNYSFVSKKEIPEGMELDPNRGILRWRPTLFQGGKYQFKIRVFDGQYGRNIPIMIQVENRNPTPKEKYVRDFGICLGLRAANPKVRSNAIRYLSPGPKDKEKIQVRYPLIFQQMKWVTFLRDLYPKRREWAFEKVYLWLEKGDVHDWELFLRLIRPYVLHFMDDPKVLRLIESTLKKWKRKRGSAKFVRDIQKTLKKIEDYNKWRLREKKK